MSNRMALINMSSMAWRTGSPILPGLAAVRGPTNKSSQLTSSNSLLFLLRATRPLEPDLSIEQSYLHSGGTGSRHRYQ